MEVCPRRPSTLFFAESNSRYTPATAAPTSRRGDASRYAHAPSLAMALAAVGYSPLVRIACVQRRIIELARARPSRGRNREQPGVTSCEPPAGAAASRTRRTVVVDKPAVAESDRSDRLKHHLYTGGPRILNVFPGKSLRLLRRATFNRLQHR